MRTLAVLNQKGGVAKTTTAVTLGHGLALRGYRVVVIDLDAQGNVADALGLEKQPGLYDWLVRGELSVEYSGRPGLYVVLGDKRTVEAKLILTGKPFRELVLLNGLKGLDYDAAILDVAPGVDLLQVAALVAATHFLIPGALDQWSVVGARDAMESAAALRAAGALNGQFLGVLPTFWERTTNEGRQQLEFLAQQFGRLVWEPIPLDVKAREAAAHGQTLWEYAPDCRALQGVVLNGGQAQDRRVGGYVHAVERLIVEVGL